MHDVCTVLSWSWLEKNSIHNNLKLAFLSYYKEGANRAQTIWVLGKIKIKVKLCLLDISSL